MRQLNLGGTYLDVMSFSLGEIYIEIYPQCGDKEGT